ncbi:MAG: putative toxin-antitoxin system toxin component, PIN family [Chloroflexaceae bacterium]
MTKRLRAVLDTNVFVSAFLSRSPTSPTRELIERWMRNEFTLLISDILLEELAEKLIEHGIDQEQVITFLATLSSLAEHVDVPDEAVQPVITADPDDDYVLACAVVAGADYLVSYDPHFQPLGEEYQGIKIVKALPFLWTVRRAVGTAPAAPDAED